MVFGRGDKQEFIVFPALQRKLRGIQVVPLREGAQLGRKRKVRGPDRRTHPAFFTEVPNV